MTNKLIIIGAGEFAEIANEYFTFDSDYDVIAFSVDREYIQQDTLNERPVIAYEDLKALHPPGTVTLFVAIPASGLNSLRKRFYLELKAHGYQFATYISSHAFCWRNAEVGENSFIFENNTIQPFVKIGNNTVLWSGNHVGHRSVIGDHCFVSSHVVISGYCTIGESCFLGVNSTLNDHTSVPERSILASGSLVTKTLTEPEKIYHGNPAKALPKRSALSAKL